MPRRPAPHAEAPSTHAEAPSTHANGDAPSTHADADAPGTHPHADTDAATAATASAAAASAASPAPSTPGGGSPPSGPHGPSTDAPPPRVRRFVTVERPNTVVQRVIKGVTRTRNVTTVDASTLTMNGDGTATTHDGTVVKVRGNEMTITYDSNNVPMHYRARITERYKNISRLRSSAEGRAQTDTAADGDTGVVHDGAPDQSYDGGHAGGHQFFPDLGRNNMFPQETGFNQVAYRNLEMEIASWANAHARVDVEVTLKVTRHGGVETTQSYDVDGRPVQQVPDRVTVKVRYSDADGNTIKRSMKRFRNVAGQSYEGQQPTAAQRAQLKAAHER